MFDKKSAPGTTMGLGDAPEDQALTHLQAAGLRLVGRNYQVAGGPSHRAGELDLILKDREGTLVFAEVRARNSPTHGGAAASVTATKQRRIVYAARHYLLRLATLPPCRSDVMAIEGGRIEWTRATFDAESGPRPITDRP